MKTLYKSVFLVGLGLLSLTAAAQKDSTLIRQVLLEREYNPTLQDASKLNVQPSIYSPVISPKQLRFVNTVPAITVGNNKLVIGQPGDMYTNVDYDKKRGYLVFGVGNNSNLEGALGYRIVNAERDRLDVFATHSSTSGTLDYIDGKKYIYDDAKAKYSATKVNLKYQHIFDPSILSFDASFYNTSFNYYGNTFLPNAQGLTSPYDITSRQNVDVISIGAGLRASDNNQGLLKYKANIRYQNFKSKYGLYTAEKGPKGGQLDLDVDFFTDFESDKVVGVKGFIMNQSFSGTKADYQRDAFHSFTNITATPYIRFEGGNWDADLGVNVSGLFDVKTKVFFSPNIKAAIQINEVNTFYAEATGGVNNNTFLDILQENRYATPATRIEYSKTVYDARLGFKSGVVSGFEFDVFAGYKQTNKDHLYAAISAIGLIGSPSVSNAYLWGNVGTPLYANVGTGHIGGLLKTNLIPYTDLSAKVVAYFYNIKYVDSYVELVDKDLLPEKKAWGRPSFTAELNADVKPMDKLTFSLNYLYAGGRKGLYRSYISSASQYTSSKMKDINELNAKVEYQIADWLSVYARANNLLFQKYELQYGYPLQGFNVLGGVNLKF